MTTSPSASQPVLTVSGPGDLVSLVPYLLGFHPRRSLVVLSLRGPRLRCGLAARFDLPDGTTAAEEFATEVVPCVLRDEPSQVALLVYDDTPWQPRLRPGQVLVDAVEQRFAEDGVPVKEAVYVGRERFWSMTCRSARCCPEAGTPVSDVRSTQAAATLVLQGRAPLADRDDLVSRVAPRGPLTTAAVASVAERELARRAALEDGGVEGVRAWVSEVTGLFDAAVSRSRGDASLRLDADEAGLLVAGMLDIGLRDALCERCSAWLEGLPEGRGGSHPPRRPEHHEDDPVTRVLRELAVMSDGQLAVAPLTLLAAQYWGAGEGALANAAVERALSLDPDYRLAVLLAQLLRAAIPPAWVQTTRRFGAGERPSEEASASRMLRD
ncbi:DUF4192 domain-containing protein [Angustibacter sp. Root456]|uniref:DUF4192 domain-containing protein n=1 Tax=Angustibacter sp. Root456 TaxID=1736539 RepID=UPI0012FB6AC2|nr:DUF4192 domain-containing protein [Angustibacter sp. Root456]